MYIRSKEKKNYDIFDFVILITKIFLNKWYKYIFENY